VQLINRAYNQPETTERTFDPYALVHGWGWWYIIGYCHLREAYRSFRVDRIIDLTLLDETFGVPADFDIHAYLASNPTEQRLVTVRLRFKLEFKRLALDNRSWWETCEEQPDGSLIVTMVNPDVLWASSIVLSFGPAVEVLEPAEVKQQVIDWAQAVIDQARSE
jgi:predicted DNA-binding transcriptional regulator YafY